MLCQQPTTNWSRSNWKKNCNTTTSCPKIWSLFIWFWFHIRYDWPSLSLQDSRKFLPSSWSSWALRTSLQWNLDRILKMTTKLARLYSSRGIPTSENFQNTDLARNIWRWSQNGWHTPSWWSTMTINMTTPLLHLLATPWVIRKWKKWLMKKKIIEVMKEVGFVGNSGASTSSDGSIFDDNGNSSASLDQASVAKICFFMRIWHCVGPKW